MGEAPEIIEVVDQEAQSRWQDIVRVLSSKEDPKVDFSPDNPGEEAILEVDGRVCGALAEGDPDRWESGMISDVEKRAKVVLAVVLEEEARKEGGVKRKEVGALGGVGPTLSVGESKTMRRVLDDLGKARK